ncbi:flagellar assembly peptidoglycan hydrolase FlgJ, partial [Verminephrobacter aporrectodeae]|uniref:flagellar assembly peptidoglycan hydrolase FlgJ n=2 Tax=Verminephrobacter aporrectodeae TaxID=1110389 RepID=UPI000237504C
EAIMRQISAQTTPRSAPPRQTAGGVAAAHPPVPSTLGLARRAAAAPAQAEATAAPTKAQAAAPRITHRDDFVQRLGSAAQRVARESGIPASFLLGHAGHETGWGRHEIRTADGANTFNLFGIKAGKGWSAKVAETTTTEYVAGAPRKVLTKFRAYGSYEDALRDYARLITENPRYEKARANLGSAPAYARELQNAGYATDPEYARKLSGAIASAQRARDG